MEIKQEQTGEAWYTYNGNDSDVVLSSRIVMSRNLSSFPFPSQLQENECKRILSIVFSAFLDLGAGDEFQSLPINNLDPLGTKILQERGMLPDAINTEGTGIVLRMDGKISCTVNLGDHLKICVYAPGLDFDSVMSLSGNLDSGLQKKMQFAASRDFGYLTSDVLDAGSGMHLGLRLHLPSLAALGKIKDIAEEYNSNGLTFSASYGSGGSDFVSGTDWPASSLGCYYDLATVNCMEGSQIDQLTSIASAGIKLKEMERNSRQECLDSIPSTIKNYVYRALTLSRSSLFMPLREAISIVSGIKWGLDMGILSGTDDPRLHSLLYRIQDGHMEYVLRNGAFNFEDDIKRDVVKRNQRLRALILQDAFKDVRIN